MIKRTYFYHFECPENNKWMSGVVVVRSWFDQSMKVFCDRLEQTGKELSSKNIKTVSFYRV